jgi:hypothetical protein
MVASGRRGRSQSRRSLRLGYCRREVEGRVRSGRVRLDRDGAPADVEEVKRIAVAEPGGERTT